MAHGRDETEPVPHGERKGVPMMPALFVFMALVAVVALTRFRMPTGSQETPPRPSWCTFFSDEDYAAFMHVVQEDFRARQIAFVFRDGAIHVRREDLGRKCDTGQVDQFALGLNNLAQACSRRERDQWPALIREHFDTVFQSIRSGADMERQLHNFEDAASLLRVRLLPQEWLTCSGAGEGSVVGRHDMEDVYSAVVIDRPDGWCSLPRGLSEKWGRTTEELFSIGLRNVAQGLTPELRKMSLDDGLWFIDFSQLDLYVTTHALRLESFPGCVGTFGTLVGFPCRNTLICRPIDGCEALRSAGPMAVCIDGFYEAGPGSISPHLYWYFSEKFTTVPYQIDANRNVSVVAPEQLLRLLPDDTGSSPEERSRE